MPGLKPNQHAGAFFGSNNSHDPSVLVWVRSPGNDFAPPTGLYRWAAGTLSPVLVPGQPLADGGQLASLSVPNLSYPDTLGRVVFISRLAGGRAGLYRLDPDGKLTLLLKTGMVTDRGTITQIADSGSSPGAYGPSLNRHDQVALVVRFDGGPNTLVLLTPTTP